MGRGNGTLTRGDGPDPSVANNSSGIRKRQRIRPQTGCGDSSFKGS